MTKVDSWAFVGCTNLKTVGVVKDGQVEMVSMDEFCERWKLQLRVPLGMHGVRPALGVGSLRARRLLHQREAAASKENAKPVSQFDTAAEKAKREFERAEQRKQLLMIQEQLKRVKGPEEGQR